MFNNLDSLLQRIAVVLQKQKKSTKFGNNFSMTEMHPFERALVSEQNNNPLKY